MLWNISNEFSLVNKNGIKEWFNAVEEPNSATIYGLMVANNLKPEEITLILAWLPHFRDKVMPFLAQEEMNLPTDSKTLGNSIMLVTNLLGGSLIGVAGIMLTKRFILNKKLGERRTK